MAQCLHYSLLIVSRWNDAQMSPLFPPSSFLVSMIQFNNQVRVVWLLRPILMSPLPSRLSSKMILGAITQKSCLIDQEEQSAVWWCWDWDFPSPFFCREGGGGVGGMNYLKAHALKSCKAPLTAKWQNSSKEYLLSLLPSTKVIHWPFPAEVSGLILMFWLCVHSLFDCRQMHAVKFWLLYITVNLNWSELKGKLIAKKILSTQIVTLTSSIFRIHHVVLNGWKSYF